MNFHLRLSLTRHVWTDDFYVRPKVFQLSQRIADKLVPLKIQFPGIVAKDFAILVTSVLSPYVFKIAYLKEESFPPKKGEKL